MTKPNKYGTRYPWDKWLGQGQVTLIQGDDYGGRTDTFAMQARQQAKQRGLTLRITIASDGASLTITPLLPYQVARDGRRYNSIGGSAPRPPIQATLWKEAASAPVANG